MPLRHLIVDRDGVLNREPAEGRIVHPAAWEWEPGAPEALARLASAGVTVSVVTNQSAIGRGIAERDEVDAVHRHMVEDARRRGGRIDTVLVCPHGPDEGCGCRKPEPDMIREAVRRSGVPERETVLVGDDLRDLEAGRRGGVGVALVRTGKGRAAERLAPPEIPVFDDLLQAVRALLAPGELPPATHEASSSRIRAAFAEHQAAVGASMGEVPDALERLATMAAACLGAGGKILACGNGGSAADAEHFAAELQGRFSRRRRALPALVLSAPSACLTAIANDYGYEKVFARQVDAFARPGDLLLALSTSGESANVLRAVEAARRRGSGTAALTGGDGGRLAAMADLAVVIPSRSVARVQEVHALCLHALAECLEAALFPDAPEVHR